MIKARDGGVKAQREGTDWFIGKSLNQRLLFLRYQGEGTYQFRGDSGKVPAAAGLLLSQGLPRFMMHGKLEFGLVNTGLSPAG